MERCEFPRCRQPAALTYLGHGICDHHHEMICAAADESRGHQCRASENTLLRKIGLVRNGQGTIEPINL